MAKPISITPSRAMVSDLLAVLDAIETKDNKEGFSAGELAAARRKLGEMVKELKPYTSKVTVHSLWAIRETLKQADNWLNENPDKNMGFCREHSGCLKACEVLISSVAIDIATTADGKEIVFGDFHGQHRKRVVCLEPTDSTNLSIDPPPAIGQPPTQAVKPIATVDPQKLKTAQLLSQGLKALGAGDYKQAKTLFLAAKKMDPSNTLIEKYIEKCNEELKKH